MSYILSKPVTDNLPTSFGYGLACSYFKRHDFVPLSGDRLWQIKTGTVRTMTSNESGDQAILGFWGAGDVVGSAISRICPYFVQCLSDVEAFVLPPNLWSQTSVAMIAHCQQSEELLNILHCRTIYDRLKRFLIWLSDKFGKPSRFGTVIAIKLTHQDIADTISSTRVSMTRTLNQLRAEGFISYQNHYLILRPSIKIQDYYEGEITSLVV